MKPTGPVQTLVRDKAGNTTGTFQTEIVSMSLSGDVGGIPIIIGESPTVASEGETTITDLGGGLYHIDSFFDVFTELSVDGGNSWMAAAEPVRVVLMEEVKDISEIICEGAGTTELKVTIQNAYPSAHYYCEIDIHSRGSIPVHIGNLVVDNTFIDPRSVAEILPHPTLDPDIRCSQQLHQGQAAYGLLHIHLENDEPQSSTLTFNSAINVNQYNEAEACN
jgi:hypothetical protein